ncbi:MAG: type I restriction enzyme S subunit [Oleispira sp.]|jgi:type I restriction enzyme S subunit
MMDALAIIPKYQAYKESGVDWLGTIPCGWDIRRIKFIFSEINERSKNGSEELLSVSQYTGVTRKSDKLAENDLLTNAETLEGYKKVIQGELVSNIMLAWNGSLGFSPFDGIVSPAYSVYRLLGENIQRYFHYLLRTEVYKAEYKRRSTGVIESRLRLYTDDFFDIRCLLPPVEEQVVIANFLDQKTAQIDEAIAIKEKQITLLKERKQIIIQKAVTQGLDPNVPMKDSGVEWIGQIPEHWDVVKLKLLANKIVDGAHFTPTYVDKGVPFLRVTDLSKMKDGLINWDNVRFIPEKEHKELIKRAKGEIGDVLISKNGTIGLTKVIDWDKQFSFFVSLCLIKLKAAISPHYFTSFFNSPIVDMQIAYGSSRTSVTNLHLEKIKELLVVLPPLNEQLAIDDYISSISIGLDQAIDTQINQIENLKEYKVTLINSAVTGKIKVA